MTKILAWIVIVVVVLVGLRLLNIAKAKRGGNAGRGTRRDSRVDTMVRCVRCGVYLPRAEAKEGPAGFVCGEPGCADRR